MRYFLMALGLLAVSLLSCFPKTTPVRTPEATSAPTMTPTFVPASFIILAYATEGISPELILYEQLTHINYSFLTPREDGTFNPIINGWKLKQIVEIAHQHQVRVNIAVGGWGWDAQFEEMATNGESRSALVKADPAASTDEFDYYGVTQVHNGIPTIQRNTELAMERAAGVMFWALNHDAQGELSLVNAIYQTVYP